MQIPPILTTNLSLKRKWLLLLILLLYGVLLTPAQQPPAQSAPAVLERNVRAHLEFLASDALQGRGSGTRDELIACLYAVAQLRQFGIAPAGDRDAATGAKSYIQEVVIGQQARLKGPPVLSFSNAGAQTSWTHGQEIVAALMSAPQAGGPLQKPAADGTVQKGAAVLVTIPEQAEGRARFQPIAAAWQAGAALVLVKETPDILQMLGGSRSKLPALPAATSDGNQRRGGNLILLSEKAFTALSQTPDGTTLTLNGPTNGAETKKTWNVVGVLPGQDAGGDAILLTAHIDHLGVREGPPGDNIYNGADDDASGCVAVLELARALGAGPQPKRTVYFVLFGSEEAGGYGARHFLQHAPLPLEKIVANLEFEMIGRPDAKVAANALWLTGYERSTLGPELARQGAFLVNDPHPEENFFQRSDNYALARQGIIAHTVSSYGLHPEYHHANDDLAHIDFIHLTSSINSMVKPIIWLVNSDFKPAWLPGQKP